MEEFSDLTTDIILEILSRLPTELVLECKLVCKPWRYLVSHHPSFSQLHLTHLNHTAAESGKLSFLIEGMKNQFHYLEYNEINDDETPVRDTRRININPPFSSDYMFIGSFNGIVCLYGWRNHAYCICNPVTREYVMIPSIYRDFDGQYMNMGSGFGFLPLTNEYKVVELYTLRSEGNNVIEVAVCTLGSRIRWRNVGSLDYVILANCTSVFTCGALYWKQGFHLINGRIFVFDLTDEKFRQHVLLPCLPVHKGVRYSDSIRDLSGVLYYAIMECRETTGWKWVNIWLLKKNVILDMKEQVEHDPVSWSKEFSDIEGNPLAITKNGGVLSHDYKSLDIYDPKASTSKKLGDFAPYRQIYTHQNTLVSLNELGEKDIKIMELAVEIGSRDSKI